MSLTSSACYTTIAFPKLPPGVRPFSCSSLFTINRRALKHPTGGLNIAGEDDAYDFGSGAGFYVDATKEPWSKGYKMYSYILSELPDTVFKNFEQVDAGRVSIFGHSMGGHGALTLVSESAVTNIRSREESVFG